MNMNRLFSGIITGERNTSDTPRRIRRAEELRAWLVEKAPKGYIQVMDPMRMLDISLKAVLQCVKPGLQRPEYIDLGRSKVLRINVLAIRQPSFCTTLSLGV